MRSSPTLSVIIPTYNRLGLLRQTIESVFAQSDSDYEVVVVDDGSTDGTRDYLESLGTRVKVLSQENRGPSAARNLGVRNASGSHIAFLDSDDLWFPWTIATLQRLIKLHNPSLLCGAMVEIEDTPPQLEPTRISAERFSDYFAAAANPPFVGGSVLVAKRSTFDLLGGFDEGMRVAEDHDFLLSAGTQPGFLRVHFPATTAYRRHTGNASTSLDALMSAANDLINREYEGRYPGGGMRQKERWRLLTRVLRPTIVAGFRGGRTQEARQLYRRCFRMNSRLLRFRFLVLSPLLTFVAPFRSSSG